MWEFRENGSQQLNRASIIMDNGATSAVILCCLLCFPDDLSFFLLEGLRISQIGMLAVDSISMLPNSGVITPSSARQIFCKEKQHQL